VQDAEAAVRFIRQHADQYRVDPQRIGAFGASAGGSIAASVATEPRGALDRGDRVSALVTWSSVFEFATVLSDPRATDYVFGTAGGSPDSPKVTAASPISHVTCDDPPAFAANSLNDRIPLRQAQMWVDALMAKKIPEELLTPPQGHATQYSAIARVPTLDFLQKWLRDAPVSTRCQHPTSTPTTSPTPSPDGSGAPSPVGDGGGSTTILLVVLIGVVVALVALALWTPRMRRVGRFRR
jgi:acetyl esterase/lipase